MIQDIAPHGFSTQYLPETVPEAGSSVLCFQGNELMIHLTNEGFRFPTKGELPGDARLQYLFPLDGQGFFLCEKEFPAPDGFSYVPIRSLRGGYPACRHLIFAAYTAWQLANWYRDNRFCGRCAQATVPALDERAIDCPSCGRRIYPRIMPAVIVGVINGDRLLLTKYADRPFQHYALVAGFCEIGETFEDTVRREVMEEVGLKVKDIRYYKSQPWGIAENLLAGFYCDVDGDATVRLDQRELKEGSWVQRQDIEGQPDDFSLTHEMMIAFREGRETKRGSF